MKPILLLLILLATLTGCSLFESTRIKGGSLVYTTQFGKVYQTQSQDPKNTSTLNQEANRTETIILPAGSLLMSGTNCIKLSSNSLYTVTTHEKVVNTQGGAQKNVLGETIAKLASLRWLTWLGAVLVLFGAASAVYPPLKLIVGSLTTSVICVAVGIGFIALPSLIVGHEILILSVGVGAVGIWWFAHHHGSIVGELKALKNDILPPSNPSNPPVV